MMVNGIYPLLPLIVAPNIWKKTITQAEQKYSWQQSTHRVIMNEIETGKFVNNFIAFQFVNVL